jgi:hypothetical protein
MAPDDLKATDRLDAGVEAYDVPSGMRAIAAWYD